MPLELIEFFVPTTAVILFGIACWLWRPGKEKRAQEHETSQHKEYSYDL
jgi:hypothetical protein